MTSRRGFVFAIALSLLVAVLAAPALADHDKGKGKSQDHARSEEPRGNKAEKSDDGEKPFDEEPNDHPSGKDRSEEPGGSGTQGKSTSDPDGDANGGADKPCELLEDCAAEQGGFDDDRDGNNGCGNDDDFEDDNNGWCGKPEEAEIEVEATQVESAPGIPTVVLGERIERPSVTVAAAPTSRRASVPLGNVLPFTGAANVAFYVALALMLMVAGSLAVIAVGERRA